MKPFMNAASREAINPTEQPIAPDQPMQPDQSAPMSAEDEATAYNQANPDPMRSVVEEESTGSALLIGTGKRMDDMWDFAKSVLKGESALDREIAAYEKQQTEGKYYDALKEEFPIATTVGEVLGEGVAFAPLGGVAAGATRAAGMATKVGAQSGVGALEGLMISEMDGVDPTTGALVGAGVGGTVELVSPKLGKAFKKLFQNENKIEYKDKQSLIDDMFEPYDTPARDRITARDIPDVNDLQVNTKNQQVAPNEEMKEILEISGKKFDELFDADGKFLPEELPTVADAVKQRADLYERMGVPPNAARISQDPNLQFEYNRLVQDNATGKRAEMFRRAEAAEQAAKQNYLNSMQRSLGIPEAEQGAEETGKAVKDALSAIDEQMQMDVSGAYNELKQAGANTGNLAIKRSQIVNPSTGTATRGLEDSFSEVLSGMRGLSPADERAFRNIGVKYGILGDTAQKTQVGDEWYTPYSGTKVKTSAEPNQLTFSNMEDLRQDLNALHGNDSRTNKAINQLKTELDDALDASIDSLSTNTDKQLGRDIQKAAKRARYFHQKRKGVFDGKTFLSGLIKNKPGTEQDAIFASQVTDRILRASDEEAKTLMSNFGKAQRKALRDKKPELAQKIQGALDKIQGDLVLRAMDQAVGKGGKDVFNHVLYNRWYQKNKGKIDILTQSLGGNYKPLGKNAKGEKESMWHSMDDGTGLRLRHAFEDLNELAKLSHTPAGTAGSQTAARMKNANKDGYINKLLNLAANSPLTKLPMMRLSVASLSGGWQATDEIIQAGAAKSQLNVASQIKQTQKANQKLLSQFKDSLVQYPELQNKLLRNAMNSLKALGSSVDTAAGRTAINYDENN